MSYSPLLGGAERLMLDLVPVVSGQVLLACPPGPLAAAATSAGWDVLQLLPRRLELRGTLRDRVGAPLRLASQAVELRRLAQAAQPDWVVAWNMRAALSLTLARSGGGPPLLFQHNDFLPPGAAARAVRAAARRADLVSVLSHAIARDLDPGGRLGDRLVVSHPGVDLARFSYRPPAEDSREVLLLGAIVAWKRPDLALEIIARVEGARLLVAGAPLDAGGARLLARLRDRAARPDLAGRVEFLGALEDPRPALRRAALLLHCSDREPFGIALVEALACGRPVVAPAAGGPLEVVDHSCGRLYPPGDADEAARAVADLFGDRATLARLAEAAREQAERRFSLREARERFGALVERLGGAGASR